MTVTTPMTMTTAMAMAMAMAMPTIAAITMTTTTTTIHDDGADSVFNMTYIMHPTAHASLAARPIEPLSWG